jgi:hypothetical protein
LALSELDRQFTEMSDAHDRATLWTREAMRVDERWSEARRLATQALSLLGAAPGSPGFSGTTFVPRLIVERHSRIPAQVNLIAPEALYTRTAADQQQPACGVIRCGR